ncbi:hypothetical protein HRbin31_00727 [bacterium HR31]|nr:hypothetical protein HRbin31_00727 [bacterium HR31]
MVLHRPPVHPHRVRKLRTPQNVLLAQLVLPHHPPRLPNPHLRRNVHNVRPLKPRHPLPQKLEHLPHLPTPLHLRIAQLPYVRPVHRTAVRVPNLREVHPPLHRVPLRPHNRRLPRKPPAHPLRLLHQPRNHLPRPTRPLRVHPVDPKHRRWVQQLPRSFPLLVRRPSPRAQIPVPRTVHKHPPPYRQPPALRLHHQRPHLPLPLHHHPRPQRVKQQLHPRRHQQVVRRNLVHRRVVRLRENPSPQRQVRTVQPPEPRHPTQQLLRHPEHHLPVFPVHVGVHPAEARDPRRRPHPPQEAVPLHEHRRTAHAGCRGRRRDPRGSPAQHHHVALRADGDPPARLDQLTQQDRPPLIRP